VFLPESRVVLFTVERSRPSERSLQALSLDTRRVSVVAEGDIRTPRYTPTGHLAYLAGETLVAAPFEVTTLRLTGNPVTLGERIDSFSFTRDAAGHLRSPARIRRWSHHRGQ
jgi:hypothetical protein